MYWALSRSGQNTQFVKHVVYICLILHNSLCQGFADGLGDCDQKE